MNWLNDLLDYHPRILVTYAIIVVFVGVMFVLADMYFIMRRRWIHNERGRWIRDSDTPSVQAPEPGVDVTGELTTGAKYAIWTYMFGILGIGGAIVGVVAGVAGYLINDLAKEKAIQVALNQMQKPLDEQLVAFATARAALDVAAKSITTDQFKSDVAVKLRDDAAFKGTITKELSTTYAEDLRGKPGKDGVSPTVEAVADALATKHVSQLRGVQGLPGKDGKDGTSPSVDAVAKQLASYYRSRGRGDVGQQPR
jgi:energy-converting hydrogenase Eha subunit A